MCIFSMADAVLKYINRRSLYMKIALNHQDIICEIINTLFINQLYHWMEIFFRYILKRFYLDDYWMQLIVQIKKQRIFQIQIFRISTEHKCFY